MKKILLIVTVLFSFLTNAQLSSLVIRGDTIFNVDPTTGVYTQLTKMVPSMSGQSGKVMGTNGSVYTWVVPFDGAYSSLSGSPDLTLKLNVTDAAATYQPIGSYAAQGVNTDITGLTLSQTGLKIKDASTHTLTIKSNETLTIDRTLSIHTNNGNRQLFMWGDATLVNGSHSGVNTGDQTISISGDGTASGSTSALSLTITKLNGTLLSGLGTGILKNSTGTGVPSIAIAADFPTLNQNTSGTAADLSAVLSYAKGGISASAATSATTGIMTVNMTSSVVTITPTGACTFNASGGVAGQILTFSVTTSGVSAFVLTFGTNFRKTGTLSTGTTSARFFTVTFICLDGTTWSEIARTAVQS